MSLSILDHWRRTVKLAPMAAALTDVSAERIWTRAELETAGETWSAEHGASAHRRVVVFAEPNGPEWFRIFLGVLAADAVAVALDPGEPLEAQRAVAKNLGALLWTKGRLETVALRLRRSREGERIVKVTSGSTGVPRALRFTDAQMIADGRQVCSSMKIGPDDVNLGCIPFGHSYGLGNLVLPLMLQGTAIVSGAPVLPQGLAATIARWRPTVFPAVPALLRALTEADVDAKQLESLRTVISAGAPLAPEVAQAFRQKFSCSIHSFYGSSETGGIAYDRTGDAAVAGRSVGTPMDGVKLRFGAGKRFWVESAAVMGRECFRPADRGELNELGELTLLGRAGRMLKIAGRRLDPAEVERALRQLPGVRDAFVDLHAARADTLVAVVATTENPNALREVLRERIASWKIPKRLIAVSEFPLTARGKTDTRKLRELLRGG